MRLGITAAAVLLAARPAAADDRVLTFFHSALRKEKKERGFALVAAGAPDGAAHWVRFEDFRVARR